MSDNNTPVVATKRIGYGPHAEDQILPGTVFAPVQHGLEIDELNALDAVAECTEADLALYSKQHGSAAEAAAEARAKAKAEKDAAKVADDAAAAADAEAAAAEAAAETAEAQVDIG